MKIESLLQNIAIEIRYLKEGQCQNSGLNWYNYFMENLGEYESQEPKALEEKCHDSWRTMADGTRVCTECGQGSDPECGFTVGVSVIKAKPQDERVICRKCGNNQSIRDFSVGQCGFDGGKCEPQDEPKVCPCLNDPNVSCGDTIESNPSACLCPCHQESETVLYIFPLSNSARLLVSDEGELVLTIPSYSSDKPEDVKKKVEKKKEFLKNKFGKYKIMFIGDDEVTVEELKKNNSQFLKSLEK